MGDVRFWVEARAGDGAPWLVAYPEWVCDACDGAGYEDTATGARCPACRGSRKRTRLWGLDVALGRALADLRDAHGGAPVPLSVVQAVFETFELGESMTETWRYRFLPACAALARRPSDVRFVFDVSAAETP